MIGTVQCVVLDCPDVVALATFYQALLGGEVNRPDPRWSRDDHWATLHTPAGTVVCFQRVADHRPPVWGDAAHPQQLHLDIAVGDLAEAGSVAVTHGATLLDATYGWHVYADPAGHPFCLIPEG